MAQSCNLDDTDYDFKELDHVSLRTRRRWLVSGERIRTINGVVNGVNSITSESKVDSGAERVDDCCYKLGTSEVGNQNDRNCLVRKTTNEDNFALFGTAESVSVLTQNQNVHAGKVDLESLDGNLLSSSSDATIHSAHNGGLAVNIEKWTPTDIAYDDLDHVVLKERQKILLKCKPLKVAEFQLEATSVPLSDSQLVGCVERRKEESLLLNGQSSASEIQQTLLLQLESQVQGRAKRMKEESPCISGQYSVPGRQYSGTFGENDSICESSRNGLSNGSVTELCGVTYEPALEARRPKKMRMEVEQNREKHFPVHKNGMQYLNGQSSIKIKVEPDVLISTDQVSVKREAEVSENINGDELDHMKLSDRMNLPTFNFNHLNYELLREASYTASRFGPKTSEYAKLVRMNRPWKRKKTATDSIETALEEDAPGLLKLLLGQGVTVTEMKLYGETCSDDDALDESSCGDSFSELEAVMSKLIPRRESFIKFPQLRYYDKGSRPSYCLACLLSLVEQARYLQFRNWPVEWGWCRDLQSFIFVFEKHKRIVMERPEYGFATYFFELVDTSPIGWQIKRLVTAMKLTSCGRVTLIENKPLLVGEDLSEGEAQVLMGYGWLPNTGLGTMLNYRDRVVHDRKHEKDTSEWRSKICKILSDAYNGGVTVSTTSAVDETSRTELFSDTDNNPPVKLEM